MKTRQFGPFSAVAGIVPALVLVASVVGCWMGEDEEIIATHARGQVTRSEYSSWTEHRGVSDTDPTPILAEVEQLVLLTTLAEDGQEKGLDQLEDVKWALQALENRMLLAALKRQVAGEIEVSDLDIAELMQDRPDAFHRAKKYRLRNILRSVPPDATAAEVEGLRKELTDLRDQALAGADFAQLAEMHSDSQSRYRGGLIGMVDPTELRPEAAAVIEELEEGDISSVIETEDGLTLLYCQEVVPEYVPTADEVRAKLRKNLTAIRGKERWQALSEELLENADIEIELESEAQSAIAAEPVVARYREGSVSGSDLQQWLNAKSTDFSTLDDTRIRESIRDLLLVRLAADHARRLGLHEDPQIENRLRWKRLEIIATQEMLQRVRARAEPLTQEEIHAYYDANAGDYWRQARYDLELIQILLGDGDPRERLRNARVLTENLGASPALFFEAAEAHSVHSSARQGGAIGWVSAHQIASLGPSVWKAVTAMRPGGKPALVQQDDNLWIVRVVGFEARRPLTFEEAAARVENKLGTMRTNALQHEIEGEQVAALDIRLTAEQ